MRRTPVPTPRRSHRERRPPEHLAQYEVEMPIVRNTDDVDVGSDSHSVSSIGTGVSVASRQSTTSVRIAELRLQQLRKEQELQRKVEEASRALALHQASSELEIAVQSEEERSRGTSTTDDMARRDLTINPARISSGGCVQLANACGRRMNTGSHENTRAEPPEVDVQEPVRWSTTDYRRLETEAGPPRPGQGHQEVVTNLSTPVSVVINQAPKMDVLSFDGKPEKYPFFKMQVEEVRKSKEFTEIQIIQHLRDRLKGAAFDAVHGMLLSGGSLSSILHVLEANFGSRFLITQTTTEKLLNRSKIRSGDVRELSRFCTEVYNAMAVLEAVGYQSELDNYRAISTLASKLSSESRLGWGHFARTKVESGRALSCGMFHEYLSGHVRDLQFSVPSSYGAQIPSDYRSHATTDEPPIDEGNNQSQRRIKNTRQTEKGSDSTLECYFCKGRHWISKCWRFDQMTVPERRAWVQSAGACRRCLSTGHSAADCRRQRPCGRDGCAEEHHILLHEYTPSPRPATSGVMSASSETYSVLMKTVAVDLTGPKGKQRCVAYLDEGSSLTLITRQLAEQLGLEERPRNLNMRTLSGVTEHASSLVDMDISNVKTGESFQLRDVYTMPSLSLGKESTAVRQLRAHYPELTGLPMTNSAPQLLIGIDHAELIATKKFRRTSKNGPYLQQTKLGWTLTGRVVGNSDSIEDRPVYHIAAGNDDHVDMLTRSYWETEAFGCKYQHDVPLSPEDRRSQEILDAEVYHDGKRWVAPLLRRSRDESFPSSRPMAEKRALAFEKRMDRSEHSGENSSLADMTQVKMDKMLADGHFRKLTREEASQEPGNTWYLPLMAVSNPNKPNRVRLVLDAAAKSKGKSLNDFLMQGPQNMNALSGVLCRWREHPIALTTDVVAMFSQIEMTTSDRPSLRFLWRGKRRSGAFDVYESPVLIFGAACSPSIAGYCFRRTVTDLGDGNPVVARAVMEDSYVDDVITGTKNEDDALKLIKGLTITLRKGGFELGPWTSNSQNVLSELQPDRCSQEDFALGKMDDCRALGVVWKPTVDMLTYRVHVPPELATRRSVMSAVMSVFDPIGYLAGWLLRGKLFLQGLWKLELTWDEEIPLQMQAEWRMWTDELSRIHELRIPRYLFNTEDPREVELHAFCDASETGFAAVLYYRWMAEDGANVSFVTARAKVAPTKKLSIPRLELQAAVLAARMVIALKKEARVKITSTTCWSDSQNVLAWIRSTSRRFHVFVANRVAEIHDSVRPEDWRYVPTHLNAADAASRGQHVTELMSDGTWFRGPNFLREDEDDWPDVIALDEDEVLAQDPETKMALASLPSQDLDVSAAVPDVSRISRWTVAVRVVALIRRWLTRRRDKTSGEFSVEELEQAEKIWIRSVQQEQFKSELNDLRAGRAVTSKSKIAALSPVLIDGIICSDTRTKNSPELSPTARQPPIILRDHRYVQLFIQHLHENMGHQAHEAVLAEIHQRYWIPQARRAIRNIATGCQQCKIRKSQPLSAQMAPLPLPRTTRMQGAFEVTGMDYFGPILSTRGRSTVKLWGVIFRCMATKAVHLEITDSLDTQATLMAISRFQARRGNVRELWSDNGRNLRAADKELKRILEELDQQQLRSKLAIDKISWKFSPPADPEAGGVWERNIRTVKEILRTILREQRPRHEVLHTLFCEIEKIMNSTPLFHVGVDSSDGEVLTPYHFLIGRSTPSYPTGVPSGNLDLRKLWQYSQRLADHFWQRWVREYLPTLAQRTKWHKMQTNVRVGDIVIIADNQHPRGLWPKGIVESVYHGADGVVRSAQVRTQHGCLHRPIRKLVILPVTSCQA